MTDQHKAIEVSSVKAIIFSLKASANLRSVFSGGCDAAVPLLGRPLLAWTAYGLKRAGITEALLALPADVPVPEQDGLPCTVRRVPPDCTSAQALLACADDLGTEDFLCLPGALLCAPDLDRALRIHRESRCPVTRLIAPEDVSGRVIPLQPQERSPAAPGALLISPEVFPLLSRWGEVELLPGLKRAGALGSARAEGYFRRVDSPAALLSAAADLLSGACPCTFPEPLLRPGVWSASPISDGAELVPPCRIGAHVTLGKGSLIGPHVCLEDGVRIGDHSLVQRSLLQSGASVGSRATVYGAVVCCGAALGHYTVLNEGAVAGAGVHVGDNAIFMEGVCVDPGLTVPPSVRLVRSPDRPIEPVQHHSNPALTVEDMMNLGRKLGRCGVVGAGGEGFQGQLLARAFGCGAAAQGAQVLFHDARRSEQAAWLARYYGWPASVFVDESGGAFLFDQAGGPLTAPPEDGVCGEGSWDLLAGTAAAYAAALEREDRLPNDCPAFHSRRSLGFL